MEKLSRSRFSLLVLLLASLLNTFLFLAQGSGALSNVEIVMPRFVRRGDDVRLSCKYDQERDQIYAVNWYRVGERKKTQEFYRYVPKEAPPQKAFQLPGYQVDVRRSTDHDVYLRNVSLDISGLYKCSVTAEQTFQTLSSTNEMTVVVIGEDLPRVHLDRAQYHPGDPVTVECQSPYSFPPANITWFYNDTEVKPSLQLSGGSAAGAAQGPHFEVKTDYQKNPIDPVTQSTLSRFSFDLPIPDKFPPVVAAITVKCRATLFSLYDQNSTIQAIAPIPRRLTGTDTLLRQGANTSTRNWVSLQQQQLQYLCHFLLVCFITFYLTTPQTPGSLFATKAALPPPTSIFPESCLKSRTSSLSSSSSIRVVVVTITTTASFALLQLVRWLLQCPVYTLLRLPFLLLSSSTSSSSAQISGVEYHSSTSTLLAAKL